MGVRAFSTLCVVRKNISSTDLVVFSEGDKDKLDILKYIKGKSTQPEYANSTETPGVFNDSLPLRAQNLFLNKLDPHFVTGFTDGEGSFIISVTKAPYHKLGLELKLFSGLIFTRKT